MPQITLTKFTAGDAARITGVSQDLQRDWRRRGFLPPTTEIRNARFDVFALARLWVLRLLADRGGPQIAEQVASVVAVGIVAAMLRERDAYAGDYDKALGWLPAAERPRWITAAERRAELVEAMRAANPSLTADRAAEIAGTVEISDGEDWAPKAEWLRKFVLQSRGLVAVPANFFVWWSDDSFSWHDDIAAAFGDSSLERRYNGAAVVLDIEALASHFGEAIGRPVIHVEFDTDPKSGAPLAPRIATGRSRMTYQFLSEHPHLLTPREPAKIEKPDAGGGALLNDRSIGQARKKFSSGVRASVQGRRETPDSQHAEREPGVKKDLF